ncbi:uncharacterized protein BDCG_17324 [Blastomyces dermatitidis ER-3]|uniref:Uncharacterized protein n=1 Tax=Ajellomyces dermatitidis (strain ER-3 / ATCC MYA-2586) TaxID=559297 RepID=A0ABX2VYS3_AJEDR|nr:uncharacterized protein BDCG_17324 [Blastomyces dermatitidis ER-3]OAT01983.1 hypothetical protein BDCG_17324 [Blastomyces dermatitidis ER-3]
MTSMPIALRNASVASVSTIVSMNYLQLLISVYRISLTATIESSIESAVESSIESTVESSIKSAVEIFHRIRC